MKNRILFIALAILFVAGIRCPAQTKVSTIKADSHIKTDRLDQMPLKPFERVKKLGHPNATVEMPGENIHEAPGATTLQGVQQFNGSRHSDTMLLNFEGIPNVHNYSLPDIQGAVGKDFYLQMSNVSFQVFDKSGNAVFGPVDNRTVWDDLNLGVNYDCDPIVLYDHLAERWMFGEMAFSSPNGPYYIVVAVSETSDPMGAWNCWAFQYEGVADFPKFGLWPDGYYMSINVVEPQTYDWLGAGISVFNRDQMLAGDPDAEMIYFDLEPQGGMFQDPFSFMPAHLNGTGPPPGTPNYLVYIKDDAWGFEYDFLSLWECSVDWEYPDNSMLVEVQSLQVLPFDANVTNFTYITQPETSVKLQSLGNRTMFPLHYRMLDGRASMVLNHTVDVTGTDIAGIRWYELSKDGDEWDIRQQGTYNPDENHRWMGSIGMDKFGNMALGYSVSSESVYPSVRYTGRYADDFFGIMSLAERNVIEGSGYLYSSGGRWGDYSSMMIDPVDEVTFWYTQQYIETTGSVNWQTRVTAFRLADDPYLGLEEYGQENDLNITAFPNPFSRETQISFEADTPGKSTLTFYDVFGNEIDNMIHDGQVAGKQIVQWQIPEGLALPGNVVLCRVQSGNRSQFVKLIRME